MLAGGPHNLVDLRRRTAHVNRNHGLRVAGLLLFDFVRIEIQRIVDVAHHGNRADFQDGFIRREKGKGRYEHFVAGAHVHRGERHLERRRAGRHAQRVFHTAVAGKLLFKLAHLENAFSLLVESVTHQNAGFHHVHDFLDFFRTDQFSSCHGYSPILS